MQTPYFGGRLQVSFHMNADTSWAVFLGGLGVGSAVTAFVQHYLARRAKAADTRLNELKEAFSGYLAALAELNKSGSRENQVNYGLWVARVQLVASSVVVKAIEGIRATEPGTPDRSAAIDRALAAMRNDLGVSPSES